MSIEYKLSNEENDVVVNLLRGLFADRADQARLLIFEVATYDNGLFFEASSFMVKFNDLVQVWVMSLSNGGYTERLGTLMADLTAAASREVSIGRRHQAWLHVAPGEPGVVHVKGPDELN